MMPYPSIWVTQLVLLMEAEIGCTRELLDQCRHQASSMKPTCLSGCSIDLSCLGLRCNHKTHSSVLLGLNKDGNFKTHTAQEYPSEMNRLLASCFLLQLKNLDSSADAELTSRKDSPVTRWGQKVPVPPLSTLEITCEIKLSNSALFLNQNETTWCTKSLYRNFKHLEINLSQTTD